LGWTAASWSPGTTGFYVKQQFAISKDVNTMMGEARGIAAIFIMWVLCECPPSPSAVC
jgi:hypothetical protein